MQVFALPRHITRTASLASRLERPERGIAARRREHVARWQKARSHGLSARQAAQLIGVSRATLYRWARDPEPRSRRPRRLRSPSWTPAMVTAVRDLRTDYPMWGKRKLTVVLNRQGMRISERMVGRILSYLMRRGVVSKAPACAAEPRAHCGVNARTPSVCPRA